MSLLQDLIPPYMPFNDTMKTIYYGLTGAIFTNIISVLWASGFIPIAPANTNIDFIGKRRRRRNLPIFFNKKNNDFYFMKEKNPIFELLMNVSLIFDFDVFYIHSLSSLS